MKKFYNKLFSVSATAMMVLSMFSNACPTSILAEENDDGDPVVDVDSNLNQAVETKEEDSEKIENEQNTQDSEDKEVDVSSLDGIDFSSKRLLVCMNESPDENDVLSSYNNVYLLQYETEYEAKVAYLEYSPVAQFVDVDTPIRVADDANVTGELTEVLNPISELEKEMGNIPDGSGMIAVIDTGSSGNPNVVSSYSVVGDDVLDINGHGTKVIEAITEQNSAAKIMSIKAFGSNGTASVSSVYAAIQLAIASNVDYINLSISGIATRDNEAVKSAILDAISRGIVVVGAAGNNGNRAEYYIPGNISEALIVGACDKNGKKIAASNYGATVDYNVVGESSSIATARMTGYISKHGKAIADHKLIFETDYDPSKDEELVEVIGEDGQTEFVPAGYVLTVTTPYGVNMSASNKWAIGTNTNGYGYDVYAPLYVDGKHVYCIQMSVLTVNGAGDYSASSLGTYLGSEAVSKKLELICALGYGYNGDTSQEMDFATQIRIWQELKQGTITNIHPDIQAKIDQINAYIAAYEAGVSFANQTFTFAGYGKTNAITVTDNYGTLAFSSITASGIHYEKNSATLKMWLEEGDTNPSLTIDCFKLSSRAGGASIAYDSGYSQDVAYIKGSPHKSVSLKFAMDGKVTLKKSSADTTVSSGNKCYSLEGTEYGVYSDVKCTNSVGTLKVKADGTSNTLTLKAGTYYVKETKAGQGYALNTEIYTVKVTGGQTATVNAKDMPVSDPVLIVAEKKDGSGKRLKDAQFAVEYYNAYYDSEPTVKPTRKWILKTNDKGQAVMDKSLLVSGDDFYYTPGGDATFPLGTVVIYETKAPSGYTLDGTTKHVIKIGLDKTGKITEYNAPVITDHQITVSKKDVVGDEVKGAQMQVVDKDGKVVDSWTSNGTEHKIKNLIEGQKYTIKEVVAADGYVKATDIPFTAGKKDQHIDVVDKLVTVSKVDVAGEEVNGAQMQVVDKDGKVVDSWTSDGTEHKVNGLVEGNEYTIKEVVAADGYVKATDITFTVSEEKVNQHIDVVDIMYSVIKVDNKNEAVVGAKLQIKDANNKIVDEWITDGNVHYVNGLTEGKKYILEEIEAPKGYIVAEPVAFTVNKNKKNYEIKMIDEMNGSIRIHKKDEDGKSLSGVIYSIDYKESKDDEYTHFDNYTTDENGEIYVGHLDFGFYRITEIKTAEGMSLLAEPIEIELPYANKGDEKFYDAEFEITDSANLIMPATGGNPTGKYFAFGCSLLLGAAVFFVMEDNKKMIKKINGE